ncbi:MAG TPA: sigma-70 family RNA polymerase sigma factor [Anaeromyxobacteraceae bacterium]|nr:sigma-70 family RNA polymerase sigma factor [Anaeromyxobacteraceae bacterium]
MLEGNIMAARDPRSQVSHLYREFGPVVYRRCLRLLRDRTAAEDATQDVFVKLLREVDRLQDRATVLPWIYRVTTNHCLNLRRNASRQRADSDDALEVVSAPGGSGPASYPDRHLAQAVLSRFDEATQQVAVAVLVDGMELEEVAEVLGVSSRTVSRRLQRFLESARRFVQGGAGGPVPVVP